MPRRGAGFAVVVGLVLWFVVPVRAGGFKQAFRGVKKYVIVNLLLATADYESARAVQHPGGCREGNRLFSHYPGRAAFMAKDWPLMPARNCWAGFSIASMCLCGRRRLRW